MTLSSNPSYQALASTAAAALGNPTQSIVKAILAQWQCELGNVSYPPTRNNPGNVAKGWADAIGIPYTIQTPNPQPSNPIVTFASASDGARAYAGGIRSFKRYAAARLAITRGDGRAFLLAITAAGYGTNVACALRVYGGTGTVSTTPDATLTSATPEALAKWQAALASVGIPNNLDHVITHDEAVKIVDVLYRGQIPSAGRDSTIHSFEGKTVLQALEPAGVNFGGNLDPLAAVAAAIGALAGQIGQVAGGIAVNGAVLVVILVLALSGARDVLGRDQS